MTNARTIVKIESMLINAAIITKGVKMPYIDHSDMLKPINETTVLAAAIWIYLRVDASFSQFLNSTP